MFESSFGFYVLFMGVLSFIFLICSLRTNVIFVIIFISATLGFCLAAAAFWTAAQGMAISSTLLKGTGGSFFVASMAGWYLLAVIMFTVVDLPGASVFPIGDLSALITGRSAKLSKDV
jgi:succinate-acetate transporter protein